MTFFIFDMDGTLYSLGEGGFAKSRFKEDAYKRAPIFIAERLGESLESALEKFKFLDVKYNGDVSIGIEKEFGVSRYEYFERVWSPNPADYIKKICLRETMSYFKGKSAILTAATRCWAKKVLEYLEIYEQYKDALFTGEPDIRKPNPLAFKQVLDYFNIPPEQAVSIGDQEENDIIPAKSLGIKTVIIRGKSINADFCIESLEELIKLIEGGKL